MQGNEQHAPDDRRSSPVAHPPWTATRLVGTVLLCGGAALFSAGFWLTRRADDPAVFGWYAPQWFAMAICATLLSGLVVYWRVGRSSVGTSRRTAPSRAASGLSVGKRIAFIAIILAPVMIGLELTLRHILRAAAVVDAVERVDPDIHYHAHLQMVKR
ncbi:MAG: hypothetical protein GY842_24750, partial [bacterium]|nr:hypothetical protein [bacterium]